MAYLIFSNGAQELSRRSLTGSLVIGRSPECDISVRDITLSRRHLKIERLGNEWFALDLTSKNGTTYAGSRISRHTLQDADVLRIGKTLLTFRSGVLKSEGAQPRKQQIALRRPADPIEALAGTVNAMELSPQAAVIEVRRSPGARPFPTPLPRPADPAYEDDDVYEMVQGLVSSSWDSIYFAASAIKSKRPVPHPRVGGAQRSRKSSPQVDIDLQALPDNRVSLSATGGEAIDWKRRLLHAARNVATLGRWAALLVLIASSPLSESPSSFPTIRPPFAPNASRMTIMPSR